MNEIIERINAMFDIQKEYSPIIDLPFDYEPEYKITAIIGGSGTGKSTLLRKWFGVEKTHFDFNSEKSIFECLYDNTGDFDATCKLMFDVGLCSVPVWKNKFSNLSNGEKLRFEIAYKLSSSENSDVIFIDEFTSMLDRQVAMNLTRNINKLSENFSKNIVIATAHYDILDWIKIDRLVDTTLKKSHSPHSSQLLTHMNWKSEVYQDICGDYLTTIII